MPVVGSKNKDIEFLGVLLNNFGVAKGVLSNSGMHYYRKSTVPQLFLKKNSGQGSNSKILGT